MTKGGIGHSEVKPAVAATAGVLTPRHFVGIGIKLGARDMVAHSEFSARRSRLKKLSA
jgi:hypothetical protein